MDEQKLKIFNAIATFVQDLNNGFNNRTKPIALYNRLMERTTLRDVTAVDRHIAAFTHFFNANPEYIQHRKLADTAVIVYTPDRIYLDMKKIIAKSDADTRDVIHQHLTLIYSLLNLGTKQGKEALEQLKQTTDGVDLGINVPDTNEGKFLKKTLSSMTQQFKKMDSNNANPMSMMTSMLQSGFLTNFVSDLQSEFSSGSMNMGSLINTVTSVMGSAASDSEGGAAPGGLDMSQLGGMLTGVMSQLGGAQGAGASGGGQPDLTQLAGLLSNTMSQIGGGGDSASLGGGAPGIEQLTGLLSSTVAQMGGDQSQIKEMTSILEKMQKPQ